MTASPCDGVSRTLALLLFVAGTVLWHACSALAQPAGSRAQALASAGELRVCIWPDYFAVTYRNPLDGTLEGIDIDMARAFARDLGVKPVFVETTFPAFIGKLDDRQCDVAMFGIGVTRERAARVDFSAPYMRSDLYAVSSPKQKRIDTWADIDQPGVTVAVMAGTYMEPVMRGLLKKARMVVVSHPATREAELQAGRVDVFISDYPYTRRMIRTYDWVQIIEPQAPVAPTNYAYAVRKGDTQMLALVDAFLAKARQEGRLSTTAAKYGLYPIIIE